MFSYDLCLQVADRSLVRSDNSPLVEMRRKEIQLTRSFVYLDIDTLSGFPNNVGTQ